jgi:hypothetical protein
MRSLTNFTWTNKPSLTGLFIMGWIMTQLKTCKDRICIGKYKNLHILTLQGKISKEGCTGPNSKLTKTALKLSTITMTENRLKHTFLILKKIYQLMLNLEAISLAIFHRENKSSDATAPLIGIKCHLFRSYWETNRSLRINILLHHLRTNTNNHSQCQF